ncbi:MAG: WbqC family protein [Candidatus Omnitrophica bacterium]|nr:WbqC family protein [Candidatus Omnitrophota bacterium]
MQTNLKEKIAVIHQPDFLPHLAFFKKFLQADLWVILDNVQFVHKTSKSWNNRDKIKTPDGEKWITIAIQGYSGKNAINEVILSSDVNWRGNNLNLIKNNYKKAAYFQEVFPYIKDLYSFKCDKLIDFNLKSIELLLMLFDIKISSVLASTLNPDGKKNDLLVDILKKVGASVYLSGIGAKNYFLQKPFDDADIKVIWHEFKHPIYPQLHGEFIPYLSSIDLLLNCGIKQSREILRRC